MSAKEIGPKERWLREMREANMNGRKAAKKPSSKELVERVAKVVKKPGKKRMGKK